RQGIRRCKETPIFNIAGRRSLARVEVDAAHAKSVVEQRDDEMHRGGRLARPTLLVPEHNDVRTPERPRTSVTVRQSGQAGGGWLNGHAGRIQTAVSWKVPPP